MAGAAAALGAAFHGYAMIGSSKWSQVFATEREQRKGITVGNKWAVLIALVAGASAAADTNERTDERTFRNIDVFEIEIAADPQLSPDGKRVAYLRRSMDIMTDSALSNIWVVDTDGKNHRPLLSGTSGLFESALVTGRGSARLRHRSR